MPANLVTALENSNTDLKISQDTCRLCLKENDCDAVSIFFEAEATHTYSDIVYDLTNLYIEENDTLPKLICSNCARNLLLFCKFKQECISADCSLKSLMQKENANDTNCGAIKQAPSPSSSDEVAENDANSQAGVGNSHPSNVDPQIDKPIQCYECGQFFTQKSSLQQHLAVHKHGRRFECQICRKKFTRKSYVKIHMRQHSHEKPYNCEICAAAFVKSSDLRRHQKVHTDRKDFVCEVCGKTFKRSTDVQSHMNSHTGRKPFKCKHCPKEYSAHSSMMKHCRKNNHF